MTSETYASIHKKNVEKEKYRNQLKQALSVIRNGDEVMSDSVAEHYMAAIEAKDRYIAELEKQLEWHRDDSRRSIQHMEKLMIDMEKLMIAAERENDELHAEIERLHTEYT